MKRPLLPLVVVAAVLAGCSLDVSGSGSADELVNDSSVSIADTELPPADTSMDDTGSPRDDTGTFDTSAPDTALVDTAMPDTTMPDTAMPDTAIVDAAPPCGEPNSGIYNGHCYFLVSGSFQWEAARTTCAAASTSGHPAHLAVITTVGEWSFVNGLPGGAGYGRWIGLASASASSMKSAFTWVTGEPFAYDAWMSGHPNGSGRCVTMHSPGFSPPGSWEDDACTNLYLAICERE